MVFPTVPGQSHTKGDEKEAKHYLDKRYSWQANLAGTVKKHYTNVRIRGSTCDTALSTATYTTRAGILFTTRGSTRCDPRFTTSCGTRVATHCISSVLLPTRGGNRISVFPSERDSPQHDTWHTPLHV